MKKIIKLSIFALLTITMLGLCGCSFFSINLKKIDSANINDDTNNAEIDTMEKNSKKEEIVLNERQMKILEEKGLPTTYTSLNHTQQAAIVAIEEILCETEKRYGIAFEYISYTAGGVLGPEKLTAYPADGDEDDDAFVITREIQNGKYVYSDGYLNVSASPAFNQFVHEFVISKTGEGNSKVYTRVTSVKDGKCNPTVDEIAHNVNGGGCIFLDGAVVSEEMYDQFMSEFTEWVEQNGIRGSIDVILLKEDILPYLSRYDYFEYLDTEYYTRRENVNTY